MRWVFAVLTAIVTIWNATTLVAGLAMGDAFMIGCGLVGLGFCAWSAHSTVKIWRLETRR